jgi:hypothetical protein
MAEVEAEVAYTTGPALLGAPRLLSICRSFLNMKITGFSESIIENNFMRLDIMLV